MIGFLNTVVSLSILLVRFMQQLESDKEMRKSVALYKVNKQKQSGAAMGDENDNGEDNDDDEDDENNEPGADDDEAVRLEELLTGLAVEDDAEAAHAFRDDDDDLRCAPAAELTVYMDGLSLLSAQCFFMSHFFEKNTRSLMRLGPCSSSSPSSSFPFLFFFFPVNQVFGRAVRAGIRRRKSYGRQCHVTRFQSSCRGLLGRRFFFFSGERWVQPFSLGTGSSKTKAGKKKKYQRRHTTARGLNHDGEW